jgi:signal transduction histidine kinase
VQYAARTQEPVVLGEALADARFRSDPYLQASQVRSVLAMPLAHQGLLVGVLYLEHASLDAFSAARVAFLTVLTTQAAIALENASLYAERQEAVRVRDELLVLASHELKTPLASMVLQVQHLERRALRREAGCSEPEARAFALFRRQLGRLGGLVDQMLDFSLVQADKLELQREECDLTGLVRGLLARLRAQLACAGCPVTLVEAGPVHGRWDRARIETVVASLLSNAVKYGANKPVTVTVELRGEAALLRVEDQGVGISSDDQRRIFERFERVAPLRHHDSGLGLGLYIARHIVLAHGGTIRVESELGLGASFVVSLPVC